MGGDARKPPIASDGIHGSLGIDCPETVVGYERNPHGEVIVAS